MLALLSLISVRDYVYGAIIAALLGWFGWYTHHERALGASEQLRIVQAAGVKAQAAAQKQIDTLNAQHAATVAHLQVTQNEQLKAAAANSADLASRLRQYEAGRCRANQVLAGSAPAAPNGPTGPGGAGQTTEGSSAVDADIAAVIAAAEHDNAVITTERAERDSLTGK